MNERVTNEQALAVKNMINGRPFIYADGNDIPADWFAADLLDARTQRDTAWRELREIREAIKADENESTADEVRSLVAKNDKLQKIVDEKKILKRIDSLYERLTELEEIATAVEADIDTGRPLEYNVEHLRDELIRARKELGILPEQEQTTTLGFKGPAPITAGKVGE